MRIALVFVLLAACGDDAPTKTPDMTGQPDAALVDAPDLPRGQWTWLDLPSAKCANGSQTGIGINLPPQPSGDLFVYFQGGGACWDEATCYTLKTAINIETDYDEAKFFADLNGAQADRSAGNVFKDATLVWVGYCTGDLHAGTETRTYGARTVNHVGADNTQIIVDTLRSILPDQTRVWIAGSSAGGYGATFNHHRFAAAWPTLDVHLLQDGAPYVPVVSNYATWQTAWSLQYPPNCASCTTNFPSVIDAISAAHPGTRMGLLHYDDDAVIKQYFGYAATAGSMVAATNDLVDNHYDQPNTKAFVIAGQGHTMFGQNIVAPGGLSSLTWIERWATGDAAWATVRP